MQVLSCKTDNTFVCKWYRKTKHPPSAPPQACCSFGPNTDEFMRDKFLFGLNESFSRFKEGIFYRDGQHKAEDPPFTLEFVVSQAVSFELANRQTNS